MRLRNGFVTEGNKGAYIIKPTGEAAQRFHGLIKSNKTAAFIVECLKEDTTEEEIIEKMVEKYDAPKERIAEDVFRIVTQLERIGALIE